MDFSRNFMCEDQETILDIVLTLLLLMVAGAYFFGYRAIMIALLFILFTAVFENALLYIVKKELVFFDIKTAMYSTMCSFLCPVSVPIWVVAFGGAILSLTKFFFEKKEKFCFTNPVVLTVAVMNAVFLKSMSKFTMPFAKLELWSAYATSEVAPPEKFLYMFLGDKCGFFGTTSVAVILICAVFLLLRGKIRWDIPLICVSFCTLFGLLIKHNFYGLFIEGLLFSSVYLMTDYNSDKRTLKEVFVYSLCVSFFVALFYYGMGFYGSSTFAILLTDIIFFCLQKFKERQIGQNIAKNWKCVIINTINVYLSFA